MFREKRLSPFSRKTYYVSPKSRHNYNSDLVLIVFKYPDISLNRKTKWGKNTKQNKQAKKTQNKYRKQTNKKKSQTYPPNQQKP